MRAIADLSHVESCAERVCAALGGGRDGARVRVMGSIGSGRHTLARRLEANLSAVVVDTVSLREVDAVPHTLYQAEACLGAHERTQATEPLGDRARNVANALASQGRILVVCLSDDWVWSSEEEDWTYRRAQAHELLREWWQHKRLAVVGISSSTDDDDDPIPSPSGGPERLPGVPARLDALLDADRWGAYAEVCAQLHTQLQGVSRRITPLELRVAAGIAGLTGDAGAAADALLTQGRLTRLVQVSVPVALQQQTGVQQAIARFLLARRPLPTEQIERIARPPRGHLPLFTQCLGYGEGEIRVSEPLRDLLLRSLVDIPRKDPSTHIALARYHAQHDGQPSARSVPSSGIQHWLERVHHLAHGGAEVEDEWNQLELVDPEFLIDRARSLSYGERRFDEAADLYERAVRMAPANAYAWHYLGYNLSRAGLRRSEAEGAFRKAVEFEPDNPWWNSRLITFLIRHGRFREAKEGWTLALDQIDPDGRRVSATDLALHLHRWVADAWLRAGEPKDARAIIDEIPVQVREREHPLRELTERIDDALEAEELGESVYPPGLPRESRWLQPQVLPERDSRGRERVAWYPGRVLSADFEGVELLFATPSSDPSERRAMRKRISPEEWRNWGRCQPEEARGFLEIGEYALSTEPSQFLILPLPREYEERSTGQPDDLDPVSFVRRRWANG